MSSCLLCRGAFHSLQTLASVPSCPFLKINYQIIPVTHLVMRFLCGFAGSAFMSVAGGSVSDLFEDHEISL